MNEQEFTQMVQMVRDAEKAIGEVNYNLTEKQIKGKDFSRSLYIIEDVNYGDIITEKNVKSIRPGFGLHPKYFKDILGKKFNSSFEKGERLTFDKIK